MKYMVGILVFSTVIAEHLYLIEKVLTSEVLTLIAMDNTVMKVLSIRTTIA